MNTKGKTYALHGRDSCTYYLLVPYNCGKSRYALMAIIRRRDINNTPDYINTFFADITIQDVLNSATEFASRHSEFFVMEFESLEEFLDGLPE